jgi:hydrogenase nickel incorporation protein HypA/HybF
MHEIGIADAIIEASLTEAGRRPGSKLVRVGVRVGVLAGVDGDALRFAFTALIKGTDLDAVDFEIKGCPRRSRCVECGREFESAMYSEPCPGCGSADVALVGGEELDLEYVELDEA